VSFPENPNLTRFDYERGEGRFKHRRKNDEAGFVGSTRRPIGKCHKSISQRVAVGLLRSGVVARAVFDDEPEAPDEIFNVYRGIPYLAVPTVPGRSYHGYPWRGRMSPEVRAELERRAQAQGQTAEFKRWMTNFESS
jgi:hypothetical protein